MTARSIASHRCPPGPGFGFITLCPYSNEGELEELIVPLGSIPSGSASASVEPEQQLGFSAGG